MAKLSELDVNFLIPEADAEGIVWYSANKKPFSLSGIRPTESGYERLPQAIADQTNESVRELNRNTAGGRIRFMTDAPKLCIRVRLRDADPTSKFSFSGKAGFDLYEGKLCRSIFLPPNDPEYDENGVLTYSTVSRKLAEKMTDYTLVFPPYATVLSLEIGLPEGYIPQEAKNYVNEKPIVYYGSSITQGGCVSHPGNAYPEIIHQETGLDYVNLGFSNGARGEQCVADYIASLPMLAFVLDYDHNAPTVEHLQKTHEAFYKTVRAAQPNVPILMLSRPGEDSPVVAERRGIIRATYENAVAAGDRHVYFLDGSRFFEKYGGFRCTVDCIHPNDLGFYAMAQTILPVLLKAIGEA